MDAFEQVYVQAAKGNKPEKKYHVFIEFSMHCFTRGPNRHINEKLTDISTELHYKDSRETRIFCPDRHELSKRLPEIAKSISSRNCYNTGKGNFFTCDIVDEKGLTQEYEVYFKLSKRGKGNALNLFIESAYIRDKEHNSAQPKKNKIGFFVIAHKTATKQSIPAPKF